MTKAGLMLAGVALVIGLVGCASLRGFPKQSISTTTRLQQLSMFTSDEKITNYEKTSDPTERQRLRNELINGRLALIDIQFNSFLQALHQDGVGLNIGIQRHHHRSRRRWGSGLRRYEPDPFGSLRWRHWTEAVS